MTLNDLEPSTGVLVDFFAILGCGTHFKSELRWNNRIQIRTTSAWFLALNVDFSTISFEPIRSRSPPHEGIKFGYPIQNARFLPVMLIEAKLLTTRPRTRTKSWGRGQGRGQFFLVWDIHIVSNYTRQSSHACMPHTKNNYNLIISANILPIVIEAS